MHSYVYTRGQFTAYNECDTTQLGYIAPTTAVCMKLAYYVNQRKNNSRQNSSQFTINSNNLSVYKCCYWCESLA